MIYEGTYCRDGERIAQTAGHSFEHCKEDTLLNTEYISQDRGFSDYHWKFIEQQLLSATSVDELRNICNSEFGVGVYVITTEERKVKVSKWMKSLNHIKKLGI